VHPKAIHGSLGLQMASQSVQTFGSLAGLTSVSSKDARVINYRVHVYKLYDTRIPSVQHTDATRY